MLANGDILVHLGASLQRIAVGLVVGVPLGVLIGCAMGVSQLADNALDPYLRMANATPAVALVPFSLLWFGITEAGRYALMIYIVVVTLVLYARQGVREVPRLRIKASETLGVSGIGAFFRVIIPSSFPSILAGIRTSIGLGVMVVVAAEMFGATSGVGYLIMQGRANYVPELMFIGILGLGLLALVLDRLFMMVIEMFMPRWSAKRRVR
jgi:ABC-type nitrate/sulfonate/bicarbonate transport system permease component